MILRRKFLFSVPVDVLYAAILSSARQKGLFCEERGRSKNLRIEMAGPRIGNRTNFRYIISCDFGAQLDSSVLDITIRPGPIALFVSAVLLCSLVGGIFYLIQGYENTLAVGLLGISNLLLQLLIFWQEKSCIDAIIAKVNANEQK